MSVIKFKRFEKPDEWGNRVPFIGRFGEFHLWFFTCLKSIASMPDVSTPSEIWITSMNDSLHMKGSRHYNDEGVDIRSKNFPSKASKLHFANRLESLLNSHPNDPNKFVVILENEGAPEEHFHVQVRKGMSFMLF